MRRAFSRTVALLLLWPVAGSAADPAPPIRFFADLSPGEQSTTTVSDGAGRADFSLERATLRLSWRITFARLTSGVVGAGIHGPQRPGTNAGVQIDLGARGFASPLEGSAVLTDAQLQYLLVGRMYVNIRSRRYPEGELRGQIQRLPPAAAGRP